MTETFIEKLLTKVNTIYTCYYEEAPKKKQFPYCVIPSLVLSPLDSGYICMVDIELYNDEFTNTSIEKMCDDLREELDGYSYKDEKIGYHLGFENQFLSKSNEQDLTYRKITFVSRIFK